MTAQDEWVFLSNSIVDLDTQLAEYHENGQLRGVVECLDELERRYAAAAQSAGEWRVELYKQLVRDDLAGVTDGIQ